MKVKQYEKQIADKIIDELIHDDKFFTKGRRNNDVVDLCIAIWTFLSYYNEQSKDEFYNHIHTYAASSSNSVDFIQRVDTIWKYIPSWEDDILSYLTRDIDYYIV